MHGFKQKQFSFTIMHFTMRNNFPSRTISTLSANNGPEKRLNVELCTMETKQAKNGDKNNNAEEDNG